MKLGVRVILAMVLVPLIAISGGQGAEAVTRPICPSTWTTVSVPPGQGVLIGIAGTRSNSLWAVGQAEASHDPLIEHWDGTSWSIAASPAISGFLRGVDVVSASDAWAVGSGANATLAEHWNGSAWSVVPTPDPGNQDNSLISISGTGPSDQWAVGYQLSKFGSTNIVSSLVEHWNGSSCQNVSPPTQAQLLSVKALSPTDVWAVGYSGTIGVQEITVHWNGTTWNQVAGAAGNNYILNGLSQSDHRLDWAAGEQGEGGSSVGAQILAWNHRFQRWDPVATSRPAANSSLASVVRVSPTDIWAVGNTAGPTTSLIEHSTGGAFTIDSSGTVNGDLSSVVVVGPRPKTAWAVGSTNASTPLIMDRCA